MRTMYALRDPGMDLWIRATGELQFDGFVAVPTLFLSVWDVKAVVDSYEAGCLQEGRVPAKIEMVDVHLG